MNKAQAVVSRELPNLLYALNLTIERRLFGDFLDAYAMFIQHIKRFLNFLRFVFEENRLNQLILNVINKARGSFAWYVSIFSEGEKLCELGNYAEAKNLFEEIIEHLDNKLTSYEFMICSTKSELGLCYINLGKVEEAIYLYYQCVSSAEYILNNEEEIPHDIKRLICSLYVRLADALVSLGKYNEANNNYQNSLKISSELNDIHSTAVINGQLGTLAFEQEMYLEAIDYYQSSIIFFDELKEQTSKAKALYHLGLAYSKTKEWKKSEEAFHSSIEIDDTLNNLRSSSITWSALASIMERQEKNNLAEGCYRESIKKIGNDAKSKGAILNNFASFLLKNNRLDEAQRYANEALFIRKNFNESTVEIWKNYLLLAEIADKKGDQQKSEYYQKLSRESYLTFSGMFHHIRKWKWLIENVIATLEQPKYRQELDHQLQQFSKENAKFVKAVNLILDGERNKENLFNLSNNEEAAVIHAILKGIENPESLETLFNA